MTMKATSVTALVLSRPRAAPGSSEAGESAVSARRGPALAQATVA
jgi:hypothetical protein